MKIKLLIVALFAMICAPASDAAGVRARAREVCPVHHVALQPGTARVRYGHVVKFEDYRAARDREFPDSRREVLGGCGVGHKVPTRRVLFCPRCRAAEVQWNRHRRR